MLKSFLSRKISNVQAKDSGLALSLIGVLWGLLSHDLLAYKLVLVCLLITMIIPAILKPFAIIWFGLAELLGTVMSRVLLTSVYIVFLVPVGLVRQLLGFDSLQLKKFKQDTESVFKRRDITFTRDDIAKPF